MRRTSDTLPSLSRPLRGAHRSRLASVTLRAWIDKLLGRRKSPPAPAEPLSFPSQRTLTEEEQAERDKADEPPEPWTV
jgi:hypothetical protein